MLVPLLLLVLVSSSPLLVGGAKTDATIKLMAVGTFGLNVTTNAGVGLMKFAAQQINNRTDLLPDATIIIEARTCGGGSNGNPSVCMVEAMTGLMAGGVNGVLSGGLTADQRVIQFAAAAFNVPQISGAASGPLMSNKHDYPTYLRTSPSDGLADTALIKLMVKLGWKNALMCLEDADWGAGNKDIINAQALLHNVNVETILCPTGATNFSSQAAYIKEHNYNIIIPMLNSREAYVFIDACNASGLFGPNYQWLVPLTIISASVSGVTGQAPWLRDIPGLRKLLNGAIGFMATGGNGPMYAEVAPQFQTWMGLAAPLSAYSYYMYDTVLAYAHAYDQIMSRGMRVADINGTTLLRELFPLEFIGTTGLVYFDEFGDRQGLINVHSMTEAGVPVAAVYDPVTQNFTMNYPFPYFAGDGVTPPDMKEKCGCTGHGKCNTDLVCLCFDGYEGVDCSTKKKEDSLLVVILVPVLGGVIIAAALVGYWYKRKHASLIKDIADRQQSDIPRHEIQLQGRIGAGGAGEVYTATFRGTQVAVKQILASKLTQQAIQEFKLECAIMCSLRHPNIVLFMGSCYDQKSSEMLLVMEYMQKGSLYSVLHNRSIALPFTLQIHLAYQTAQGINFLHQCNPPIIHGDIKSHNVLLDSKWCARISDFGVTKLARFSQKSGKTEGSNPKRSIGTIFWAAPEVLNGSSQSKQSDCYSFGITLYEIFHRKDPYPAGDPLYIAHQVAQFGHRPAVDTIVPHRVANLMQRCWADDPLKRPTFEEVTRELCDILMVSGDDVISKPSNASNVCIVATEIDNASTIWNDYPTEMHQATVSLNEMIRQQIGLFHGHESDYEDERFFITFSRLEDALNWCLNTQAKLLTLKWPEVFANYPLTATKSKSSGEVIRVGLRMNMALHMGMPISRHDQKLDTADLAVKGGLLELLGHVQNGATILSSAVRTLMLSSQPTLIEETTLVKHHDAYNESRIKESTFLMIKASVPTDVQLLDMTTPLLDSSPTETLPHSLVDIDEDGATNMGTKKTTKSKWDISYASLKLTERIGKSYVCEVFKTNVNNQQVAVKHYFNQYSEDIMLEFKSIVVTASKFSHPNVVRYVGLTLDPNITLIQEYVPCGTLKEYLTKGVLPDKEKQRICKEIAEGMKYLGNQHDNRFAIHHNMRSTNVYVSKNQEAKITDYAIGILYDSMRTITAVDSVIWTAPEVFQGTASTPAASIYSFGMLAWEIFAQKQPFENIHPIKLIAHVLEGHRPPVPDDWPHPVKAMLQKCWSANPHLRPTWAEICSSL